MPQWFQIVEFSHHTVSFVQVRGSVPVYWSQTGIKYKPPPRIEKGRLSLLLYYKPCQGYNSCREVMLASSMAHFFANSTGFELGYDSNDCA